MTFKEKINFFQGTPLTQNNVHVIENSIDAAVSSGQIYIKGTSNNVSYDGSVTKTYLIAELKPHEKLPVHWDSWTDNSCDHTFIPKFQDTSTHIYDITIPYYKFISKLGMASFNTTFEDVYKIDTSEISLPFSFDYKKVEFKNKIKKQMMIIPKGRASKFGADFSNIQPNEMNALMLLKRMIDPKKFRKYLKYGIISIKGKSNLTYEIRRTHSHIHVYSTGKKIAELCVSVSNYKIPPTDNVVTKIVLIECDEQDLWKRSNIYWKNKQLNLDKNIINNNQLTQLAS